ncbi:MAG: Ig-like domain-containing protein, partial [Cellvibrionaceae bacterium]|nr:Ig-like domain-containing protein [Cellvibrionaceae bacterium]
MPVIRGGGSPGATIEIFNGNSSLGTAVVDANGEWSFAANLGEGEHIISAIHTDLAANTGPRSEAIKFEVRLGLEAAEAIRILDGGDEHLSQADLRGQVGVEVELSDNALAGQRLEIDVNGDGISDGSHVITAADIGNTVQVQIAGSEFARFDNGVLRATAVVTSPGTDRRSDAISDTSNATVLTLTRNEDSEYTTTAVVNMWQGNKLSSVHVGKSGGGIFDFDIDTPNQVLNGSHSVVVKLAGIDDIWYVYHWSSYAFEQGGSVDISELYSERQGYLDQGAIHWFWDKAYQIFMDTDKLKAPPTSSGQLPAAGVGGVSEAAGEDLWHTTVYDTRSYNVTLELGLRDNATGEVSTFETLNFDHQLIHYLTVNWNAITPLVLDLDGDGVETLGSEDAIIFDINADGYVDKTGWVAADDGLLVRDINGDGVINDGSELFGAATTMADGSKAEQGFAALADLDSNGDGVFDSRDQAYGELQVWRDINADGISQASELMGLMEAGVASIDLNAREVAEFDQENYQGLRSSWVDTEGASHDIDDVWFVVDLGSADNNAPEALAYEELLASAAESVLTGNGQNEASLPEATMLDLTAEPELLQHQCYWEALS